MNVPKLRFKEFDGEWEHHKFSEIVNRVSKSSNSNILPKVEFEDIVAGEGRLKKNVANKFDDRKGTLFQPNNILYGKLRPYLKNWLFPKFQGVALGDFWVFEAVNSAPAFLYTLIQSENYQRAANDTAGTKMPRSDWKKVSTTKFAIPMNIKEQEKIGNFFEILDKKIQLQQQKIDLLQEQKKGFLQKMFPKVGAVMPEIRFTGFTDDWGQRNIKEISKVFIGLVTSMTENYRDEGTLLIRNSDIKPGRLEFADNPIHLDEKFAEKNATRRLQIGDVVTVHTGDIGTSAVIGERENGAIGFATINTRPDTSVLDSAYLNNYFNTTYHKNWAIKMSTGDGRSNYNLYDFNRLMIPLPRLEEQKKIGAFINKLDDTIALHQQKLDFYKEQKKGFMQQMFI